LKLIFSDEFALIIIRYFHGGSAPHEKKPKLQTSIPLRHRHLYWGELGVSLVVFQFLFFVDEAVSAFESRPFKMEGLLTLFAFPIF
jgi:hypothetical protein